MGNLHRMMVRAAAGRPVAAGGVAATGGTVTTPGDGYKYHTFNTSDDLVVTTGGDVEYLVVAGGGGGQTGGYNGGGGGGAGGVLSGSLAISSATHPVTVGAGGAADTNGSDSSFGTIATGTGGGVCRLMVAMSCGIWSRYDCPYRCCCCSR